MPAVTLVPADLAPFAALDEELAQAMIDDALAVAAIYAPCILTDDFAYAAAAKAILRGAILRWHEAGTGAIVSQTAGPFGQTIDNKQQRRSMFWPSELDQLRDLCRGVGGDSSGAFSIDTVGIGMFHQDICDLVFGGLDCSCGAVLTLGWPLYEWGC